LGSIFRNSKNSVPNTGPCPNKKSTEQTPLFSANLSATGCHPIEIVRPYSFASPDFSRFCHIQILTMVIINPLNTSVNPFSRSCTIVLYSYYFSVIFFTVIKLHSAIIINQYLMHNHHLQHNKSYSLQA